MKKDMVEGTRMPDEERRCKHWTCAQARRDDEKVENREECIEGMVKSMRAEETEKDRYLPRPALSSYRPLDLDYHHWAPHQAHQMDHCWTRPVTHQARTQEHNTFVFLFNN